LEPLKKIKSYLYKCHGPEPVGIYSAAIPALSATQRPDRTGVGLIPATWVFVPADGTWDWVWSEVPVSAPILESDLRVFSENIQFSEFNPEESEDITIFAEINYWATSTVLVALNVPINFYAIYPGTPKMKIGETIIDSLSVGTPDFGSRYV
jgi:hypothetical protein